MPVGMCLSCTAEEVLLIFWPPGPEPLRKFSIRSASRRGVRGGRGLPLPERRGVVVERCAVRMYGRVVRRGMEGRRRMAGGDLGRRAAR